MIGFAGGIVPGTVRPGKEGRVSEALKPFHESGQPFRALADPGRAGCSIPFRETDFSIWISSLDTVESHPLDALPPMPQEGRSGPIRSRRDGGCVK